MTDSSLFAECILGVVTEKAKNLIKQTAKEQAQGKDSGQSPTSLQPHRWMPVKLLERHKVSEDTRTYTFALPEGEDVLGLATCQHVQIGFHMTDKMVIRNYTPTRPLLPASSAAESDGGKKRGGRGEADPAAGRDARRSVRDGNGTFDLTVKTYFPDANQPGGALSNILDCIPIGEEVEIRGPTGDILYNGFGHFTIEGKQRKFARVSLVLGGSGITPGYALIARILLTKGDKTQLRVVDANRSEQDILLREELDGLARDSDGQLQITYVLDHPSEGWKGRKGHVNAEILKEALFGPAEDSVAFLCGPPAMIQKAVLPALTGELCEMRPGHNSVNGCQIGGTMRTRTCSVSDAEVRLVRRE